MKHVRAMTMGSVLAGVLLAWCACPAWAQGGPDKALPEFRVSSADGQQVLSSAISGEPHWLLVYVSPDSPSSRRLVTALEDWKSPQLIARTVIVVRGSVAEAAAWAKSAVPQELSGIRWLADSAHEAWSALGLKGTPVIIGIDNGKMAWRLAGVLNKPGALESVVRTWVEVER